MDFYRISRKEVKGDLPSLYPDFLIKRSKDLMVRGGRFLAVWDSDVGLWSTDEYMVREKIDAHLEAYSADLMQRTGEAYNVNYLSSNSNKGWREFKNYVQILGDNAHDLDSTLTFADTDVKKEDYASKRLPYSLQAAPCDAWDELVGTLYSVEERAKVEWIIGAIVSGDSKKLDKFGVFYGDPGSGKGTILKIIGKLFTGYTASFDAKSLGVSGKDFAAAVFADNPLVAIQDDGDLSRIEDNTKLNMIVSHEPFPMNEKYKAPRSMVLNSFLLMGTNQPVKISDAKSGLLRRLIDIHPTGVIIPRAHYDTLMTRVDFELGAIAQHCLDVYRKMGKNYYGNYRPLEMMFKTDVMFNFVEAHYDVFKNQEGVSVKQAYSLYVEWVADTGVPHKLAQYKFREELKSYFKELKDRHKLEDGTDVRGWYTGFNAAKFKAPVATKDATMSLVVDQKTSLFDEWAKDWPAQYATEAGIPKQSWKTLPADAVLGNLDTSKLHYVKVPENHIVIDFDLKDENGEKSLERNLQAASVWPPTYAELSQGGAGVHLHYLYEGDVSVLSPVYSDGIEVKALLGDSSLRRRFTLGNNVPMATVPVGALPEKERKVITNTGIKDERHLRNLIEKSMRKENGVGTKVNMDFIKHILDEAYNGGLVYDVTDMQKRLMTFAMRSTHQAPYCLAMIPKLKMEGQFNAKKIDEMLVQAEEHANAESTIAIFDVEVYPNLFVICWKYLGSKQIVKMINPSPAEVEQLLKLKLVGYNNRRYDNHILYARMLGATNYQLYTVSQRIVNNDRSALYAQAYGLSYADIYDFATIKQTLKKWEIDLNFKHSEMDLPWDQPVPEELWDKVVEYCCDDVRGTEATFNALQADYTSRKILAELSGLTVNHTTQRLAEKIIFGNDAQIAKTKFNWFDLALEFPGYKYDMGKSTYRGELVGEGGLVRAKPGMYKDVAVLDVESMHPTTIEVIKYFGPYTEKFSELKNARTAIKNKEWDRAREMLDGKLRPYLEDTSDKKAMKRLSDSLKIVINSVYGFTSARFENAFRDPRNHDNIVAKRGALFMLDLADFCDNQGIEWVHIKTDSIKLVGATAKQIAIVTEFSSNYGYKMVHEATYSKFCLVNDAVYIAKYGWAEDEDDIGKWVAVGKQFQQPYVYKTLFSGEPIGFEDLTEVKQVVKGSMYLDFRHDDPPRAEEITDGMQFIGRIGKFVPVSEGQGGATLWRMIDGKAHAVSGTKGRLWMEADMAKQRGEELEIDLSYHEALVADAVSQIEKYGSFAEFVGDEGQMMEAA